MITKPIDPVSTASSKKSNTSTPSLNESFENILDIPIIIANDSENLNTYESLTQAPVNVTSNKMVLINSKTTDLDQLTPINSQISIKQNEHNAMVVNRGPTVKPTVKYTRIILTKKNESEEKSSPVILTKTRRSNKHVVPVLESNQGEIKKAPGID